MAEEKKTTIGEFIVKYRYPTPFVKVVVT